MSYGVQGASSTPYVSQTASQGPQNPFANANGPFANLDLTSEQQQQIASIFSQNGSSGNSKQNWQQLLSQVESVLTPQQQQTFQTDLQQLRANHHHRSGGSSDNSSTGSQQSQGSQGTRVTQSSSSEEIDISITINISGYNGGVSTSA